VESLPGPAGGYRLAAGAAMPPLLLDDDEAIAIAVGLRTAAGSSVTGIEETALRALVKLGQVLPAHLRRRVSALGRATVTLGMGGGPTADPQILSILAAACRDGERVRFLYRGRDGAESRREVEPHSLVSAVRRWYLVAWDVDRRDWRTFRVDRLASRPVAVGRFTPRPPPAEDLAAFVARGTAVAAYPVHAEVVVHAPVEVVAERLSPGGGILEPAGPDESRLTTGGWDLDVLTFHLLTLDLDFTVEEPPELVERIRRLAGRLDRATRAGAPGAAAGD
ncbi:MAG: WYL domain-containing protein, partial [Acidimicrobiia bacterium]